LGDLGECSRGSDLGSDHVQSTRAGRVKGLELFLWKQEDENQNNTLSDKTRRCGSTPKITYIVYTFLQHSLQETGVTGLTGSTGRSRRRSTVLLLLLRGLTVLLLSLRRLTVLLLLRGLAILLLLRGLAILLLLLGRLAILLLRCTTRVARRWARRWSELTAPRPSLGVGAGRRPTRRLVLAVSAGSKHRINEYTLPI
jgi:hypothetical protein